MHILQAWTAHLMRTSSQIKARGARPETPVIREAIRQVSWASPLLTMKVRHELSSRTQLLAWFIGQPDAEQGSKDHMHAALSIRPNNQCTAVVLSQRPCQIQGDSYLKPKQAHDVLGGGAVELALDGRGLEVCIKVWIWLDAQVLLCR